MAIWLIRAGKTGEFENKFLNDNRVYLTWTELNVDLRSFNEKKELYNFLVSHYDLEKEKTAINWASQIWPIAHDMEKGDWVVTPSKINRTIHIGEIKGDYTFEPEGTDPYLHYREIDWFATDIPRDNFDQDLLYSMGAFMTICRIKKNNAEERIKAMAKNNWKIPKTSTGVELPPVDDEDPISFDIEEYVADRISERIIQRFKGHRMEELIKELLEAKGFTTYRSPEGADHGVDILASSETLGFGSPKICVQVKTNDGLVDRMVLDQLIGSMANFNADYGLLVSWSGFKSSVIKEIPKQFFKVRLWDAQKIINEIYANYDKLSDSMKAEIPLKRIWILNEDEA